MKSENNYSDDELIVKLKNHDKQAMTIFKNYWKSPYISIFRILRDKKMCVDIVPELFIKIWNNRDNLNIISSIQGYRSVSIRYEACIFLVQPITAEAIKTITGIIALPSLVERYNIPTSDIIAADEPNDSCKTASIGSITTGSLSYPFAKKHQCHQMLLHNFK